MLNKTLNTLLTYIPSQFTKGMLIDPHNSKAILTFNGDVPTQMQLMQFAVEFSNAEHANIDNVSITKLNDNTFSIQQNNMVNRKGHIVELKVDDNVISADLADAKPLSHKMAMNLAKSIGITNVTDNSKYKDYHKNTSSQYIIVDDDGKSIPLLKVRK